MAKSFPNTGATVIDATADLPGSPSEGMMVFQKDTNELKIYDGAVWVSMLDTDTPPAMVLIQPTSVSGCTNTGGNISYSATTSMNVNGVFTSAYENYVIEHYTFTSTASVTNGIFVLTASGSPSIASYYERMWYNQPSIGFTTAITNNTSALSWMFYGGNVGGGGRVNIYRPAMTYNTTFNWAQTSWNTVDNITTNGGGLHYSNSAYDGFKITSTTAFSGNLRVYGIRNNV